MRLAHKEEIKKECIGKSKGGLSTKIHATCDALGNPTGIHLTPGQSCDLEGADVLLRGRVSQIASILADKAYDAEERVLKVIGRLRCYHGDSTQV